MVLGGESSCISTLLRLISFSIFIFNYLFHTSPITIVGTLITPSNLYRMENIISHFSHKIRRRAASDSLVSTGGVSAFVQAVLTPELAVMLVKEDMKTDDEGARAVLRDSAEVGHLLNEEEDEVIQDPESEAEYGEEKVIVMDDDDNNDKLYVVEEGSAKIQRKRKKRLQQQQEPDKVSKQEQAVRTQTLLVEIFGKLSEDEDKLMMDPK